MAEPLNSPEAVERHLAYLRATKASHPDSPQLPTFERNQTFHQELDASNHFGYLRAGEKAYGIARLFFQLWIWDYALFFCQQSIENYLKSLIKSYGKKPDLTHSLAELLVACRLVVGGSSFLSTEDAETIIQRFDPYNEWPRYPVLRTGPRERVMFSQYPEDMYMLDYFVYRMRELLPTPEDHATLFRQRCGDFSEVSDRCPAAYELIWSDNLNVQSKD